MSNSKEDLEPSLHFTVPDEEAAPKADPKSESHSTLLVDEDFSVADGIEHDGPATTTEIPPVTRSRRYSILAILIALLCVVAAVSVTVAAVVSNKNEGKGTTTPDVQANRETVERLVGSAVLDDPSSPYAKALHWITFQDPKQLMADDAHFLQRYIVAYVYFATSSKKPWRYCNPDYDGTETCSFSCSHTCNRPRAQRIIKMGTRHL